MAGRFSVVEREGKAGAFDRLLLHSVQFAGRGDAAKLIDSRDDVDNVEELRAQTTLVLDARRPGDDHGVARAAKVARNLLGPLKGRVHGVRPCRWEVVEVLRTTEFIDRFDVVLPFFRKPVEEHVFAERTLEASFGAGPVIARDVDDHCVVAARKFLDGVDDTTELVVAVRGVSGEDLHHARVETLLVGVE